MVQIFERAGRPKHEHDVIDWIWNHIQNPELIATIAALKAAQAVNNRGPAQILQEIAKEVPNLAQAAQRVSAATVMEISELATNGNSEFVWEGQAPAQGPHTTDGKLFCGRYSHDQWFHDSMDAHRDNIMSARDANPTLRPSARRGGYGGGGGGGGGGGKSRPRRRTQAVKFKEAKATIAEMKVAQEQMKVRLAEIKTGAGQGGKSGGANDGAGAGNAFGGKSSMRGKPG
jgi:hypothetical protein